MTQARSSEPGVRTAMNATVPPPPGPNPNWALVAAVVGTSMIFADSTAVNVALPILQRDLQASAAAVQWVVEGYTLMLSALILIGGSLGDIFGRRLVFGCGIALFTAASAVCAAAPNIDVLIAARCVQGAGGALATPGSLALLSANFGGAARGRAIGTWSAFSVIVSAVGPVLGGWLVQMLSWRAIFAVNLPLAAIVITVLALRVRESRDPDAPRAIDVAGAVSATSGLGLLVFGLIWLQGSGGGLTGPLCIVAGGLLLTAFVEVERRSTAPMLPLAVFTTRPPRIINMYTFMLYAALGGSFYYVPFDLIDVQHYSPLAAGAALLPMTLIMFVFSRSSGGLVARFGPKPLLAGGALLAALGFVVLASTGIGRSYWLTIFPAAVLLGCGATAFVAPLTTLVMNAAPAAHAGIASGINNAVARVAGLVAIAVLGIVASAIVNRTINAALAQRTDFSTATRIVLQTQRGAFVGGSLPLRGMPLAERARVTRTIAAASARGFSATMLICALLSATAAALALDKSLSPAGADRAFTE
jgi:EmrB/QacA subfamily drug resistance transporter